MVGDAFADDVEGGAVVDGGADDGEAERDVYGVGEGDQFDGYVSLVVVHGDDAVEFVVEGAVEQGVTGEGTGYFPILGVGPLYGWFEGDGVFFSEEAVLAGVRVEAGEHGQVAVKVIDPRGNEVMTIHKLEG